MRLCRVPVNENTTVLHHITSSSAVLQSAGGILLSMGRAAMHITVRVPHVGFVTTDCHLPFLSITAIYHAESYERSNFELSLACICIIIFMFMLNRNYSKCKGSPWYVPNSIIHTDLQIPTVKEEISNFSTKYREKLITHPNEIISALLEDEEPRRIKPTELTRF